MPGIFAPSSPLSLSPSLSKPRVSCRHCSLPPATLKRKGNGHLPIESPLSKMQNLTRRDSAQSRSSPTVIRHLCATFAQPRLPALMQRLPVLLLLLLSLALNGNHGAQAATCAWRTCHTVTVDYLPSYRSSDAFVDAAVAPSASSSEDPDGSGGGGGGRSVVLHRCHPSNNFPDKCHLIEFTSEPDGVRNFTMRGAELTEAPLVDLCQFRRLSGLDLADNRISGFGAASGGGGGGVGGLIPGCLSRLRWLSLRANDLQEADLSQFMALLPALEKLDLTENSRLESLYLSQQPRTDSALKVVLAAKCRIKQVDISLVRLPSLQDIDLSYNQVSRLTNRLDWRWTLRDVREIEVERNSRRARDPHYYARLSVLIVQNQVGPEAFDRSTLWGLPVPDLVTELDGVVNQLKHYRDAFQSFLYIDNFGSTITCDCHLLHAWSYLRQVHRDPAEFSKRNALSLAYWLRLPCDPPPGLPGAASRQLAKRTLASLSAADLTCPRPDGCPRGCSCLERVSPSELVVDCRGADLVEMPDRLPASVHPVRYVLLLGGNHIRAFTAPLNADRVQDIDLSRNLITEAADFSRLAAFTHLHTLNLTGNPIRRLPQSLLNIGRSEVRPRVYLLGDSAGRSRSSGGGGGSGFHCDCGLFEPDAWESLRRLLHPDDLRRLRCLDAGDTGQQQLSSEDYRLRYCSRQLNTTSIVYRERQEEVGPPTALVWIGAGSAALFVMVALVVTVLIVLRCRGRARDKAASSTAGPLPLSPPLQLLVSPTPLLRQASPTSVAFDSGCVSPDYLPPPGYSTYYEAPRYAPPNGRHCHRHRRPPAAALVILRGSACDVSGGGGGGGVSGDNGGSGCPEFRGRLRSRSTSGSGGDDGCSGSSGSGYGGSDPSASIRAPRRRSVHGHHGGRSGRGLLPPRFPLERELLLPPPLPPRTHHPVMAVTAAAATTAAAASAADGSFRTSSAAGLVTDV